MFGLGWMEIVIILFVALLIFGRRLPEVGRSLGKGIVEFKKGLKGIEDEMDEAVKDERPRRRYEDEDADYDRPRERRRLEDNADREVGVPREKSREKTEA